MEEFHCIIHYPAGDKKFDVILDNKITIEDLVEEFLQQIIKVKTEKITFIKDGIMLQPNIPLQQQIKRNDTIIMNSEAVGGLGQ